MKKFILSFISALLFSFNTQATEVQDAENSLLLKLKDGALLLILPPSEKDCKRFWIEPDAKRFAFMICVTPSQPHLWSMEWTSRHSLISSAMCLPQLP